MSSLLNDDDSGRLRPRNGIRWRDEARFIRTWLEHPRATGAVSPSSRALSRAIAREVDPLSEGPIVELGPGTGPVTDALLARGIAPERLVLVEFDTAFCKLLARRFPRCRVVQGDAYALGHTLRQVLDAPAAAVVSGLPLLNRPEHQRLRLLADAFALMRPGGPFVQFTYGVASPIPRLGYHHVPPFVARASAPVWLNLPPARVWTYRAVGSTEAAARTDRPDLIDRLKLGGERFHDEWREHRARIREELMARSADAKAGWRARTDKVKSGIVKGKARIRTAKAERASRSKVDHRTW